MTLQKRGTGPGIMGRGWVCIYEQRDFYAEVLFLRDERLLAAASRDGNADPSFVAHKRIATTTEDRTVQGERRWK
jgi:hypothetical protein